MKKRVSYICPDGHSTTKPPAAYNYRGNVCWVCKKCGKKGNITVWKVEDWAVVGKI